MNYNYIFDLTGVFYLCVFCNYSWWFGDLEVCGAKVRTQNFTMLNFCSSPLSFLPGSFIVSFKNTGARERV